MAADAYTSRGLITGADAAESLAIGKRASDSLVGDRAQPGGAPAPRSPRAASHPATSPPRPWTFVAPYGQALPGVPVWQAGPESRYPGLAYVVFPGNVGGDDALVRIVRSLDAD